MPFSIDPIFYGAKFYTQTKTLDIAGLEIYMTNTEELYNLKSSKMMHQQFNGFICCMKLIDYYNGSND